MDNLRPCIITSRDFLARIRRNNNIPNEEKEEKRGYFHRWEDVSRVIEPSPMVGGHSGGVERMTLAIVELEDGTVVRVQPYQIKFTDREGEGNGKAE